MIKPTHYKVKAVLSNKMNKIKSNKKADTVLQLKKEYFLVL